MIKCDPKYISLICDGRVDAMRRGDFVWNRDLKGWVDVTRPKRECLTDRYRLSYYGMEDHTGEPYVWHDCPYCGSALPNPTGPFLREANPKMGQPDEGAE